MFYFTKFKIEGTNVLNFVNFKCETGKRSCMSICHLYDYGCEIYLFQKYLWAHDVPGTGDKKWVKHHTSNSCNQGWLHNLWGPVQNENAEPVTKIMKNFKAMMAEHYAKPRGLS